MDARGQAQKGLEGRHWGAAPVEAEDELIQGRLEMVVADSVMGVPVKNSIYVSPTELQGS